MNININRIKRLYKFSSQESAFIKNNKTTFKKCKTGKVLIVQSQNDLPFLKNFLQHPIDNIIDVRSLNMIRPHFRINYLLIFPVFLLKKIENVFLSIKLKKIYSSVGVSENISVNLNLFKFFKMMRTSRRILKSIKNKNELVSLKFKNTIIGDLVYDSYLRYYQKGTVSLNDPNLLLLLTRTLCEFEILESLTKTNFIYFTGYTSYVASGLPVRVFLKNNIEVVSFNSNQNGKRLSLEDYYQTKNYWNYKEEFQVFSNKNLKIKEGLELINSRLNGNLDLKYMGTNPYHKIKIDFEKDYEGVLFLHDFTDSNHIYRCMVFPDFYEWCTYTFNLIEKYDLKILIKPHPNQNDDSKRIVKKLQKKYRKLLWLDERVSNKHLFSNGMKFGISLYGTVLTELAYCNIKPICCGDNPTVNYDFTFNAKTKTEYKNFILNHCKLKFQKNRLDEIGEFVYINHIVQ